MINLKKKSMKSVVWVLVFYFVLSPAPLQFLLNNGGYFNISKMAFAKIDKEANEIIFNKAKEVLIHLKRVEEPDFWKKHKSKIYTGAGIVIAGVIIWWSGGLGTPAAKTVAASSAALGTGMYSVMLGTTTVTATSAVGFSSFSASVVAIGAITGGTYFFSPTNDFMEYMKQKRLIMTEPVRREILSALNINRSSIVNNSSSEKEVLKKINDITLPIIKRNEAKMPKY